MAGIIGLIYLCVVIGVSIFMLSLCWRFVRAHERLADTLEVIARKLRDDGKE